MKKPALLRKKLIELWLRASVPTVKEKSVVNKVLKLFSEWRSLNKIAASKRDSDSFVEKMSKFSQLFDIAVCQCDLLVTKCKCILSDRVPVQEIDFLLDQRGARQMYISGLDRKKTICLQRKNKVRVNKRCDKPSTVEISVQDEFINDNFFQKETASSVFNNNQSEEYYPLTKATRTNNIRAPRNKVKLKRLAREVDRYGISNRAAAAIANAALMDYGFITETNKMLLIDHKKMERNRKISRKMQLTTIKYIQKLLAQYILTGRSIVLWF